MKSYLTLDQCRICGKAWQVRIQLAQWQKEAGPAVAIKDFLAWRVQKP
ncbi:hypothetical protein J2Z69_000493 [Paenibacillus shirakamiensis]|uniref:Uracil-DNA glycosylase n=1 Tax=Paenibacillus shirakamiensis TaxID=1265935 RepID=A0ABS4JCM4_9BACL|nr:Z-ring formation inhibitor MciZ [Paenibacillus shirakamiensis]MBP1999474.1 hypothetical protein [Paenibacillus shirakamiensis]